MKELIIIYLPYILSFITIYMTFLVGNKNKKGWALGCFNQILWFIFIITSKNYGLMPMNVAFFYMYMRNYEKWEKEEDANL